MRAPLLLILALHLVSLPAHAAEWQELRAPDGKVVQLAADFRLEDIQIDGQGDATFRAVATVEGAPAELSFRVNHAKAGSIQSGNSKTELAVMRLDVEIRSLGASTRRLEDFLNRRLQTREATRVTGLYSGLGWELASALNGPAFILAGSVGIATDDAGKQIEAENFSLTLFLDLPLKRATLYFHEQGGYGGTAAAHAARRKWLEAVKESSAATPSPAKK